MGSQSQTGLSDFHFTGLFSRFMQTIQHPFYYEEDAHNFWVSQPLPVLAPRLGCLCRLWLALSLGQLRSCWFADLVCAAHGFIPRKSPLLPSVLVFIFQHGLFISALIRELLGKCRGGFSGCLFIFFCVGSSANALSALFSQASCAHPRSLLPSRATRLFWYGRWCLTVCFSIQCVTPVCGVPGFSSLGSGMSRPFVLTWGFV